MYYGGGKKLKMMFYARNESKIRPFNFSDKMGCAFLAAEKWAGCIFSCIEPDRVHFWTAENWARHCALLKTPRGNTT